MLTAEKKEGKIWFADLTRENQYGSRADEGRKEKNKKDERGNQRRVRGDLGCY